MTRELGSTGPAIFPIGLGAMAMSGTYGPTRDEESIATIQAALDVGINLLDTGDFYGMGHNELLIALDLQLTSEQLERIERAVPADAAAGSRYGDAQMAALDSER